jgi:hypothetical protein
MPPALQHLDPRTRQLLLQAGALLGAGNEGVSVAHDHQRTLLNLRGRHDHAQEF